MYIKQYAVSLFDGHMMGFLLYNETKVLVRMKTMLEPNYPSSLKVCGIKYQSDYVTVKL